MKIIAHSYISPKGFFLNGKSQLDFPKQSDWKKIAYQHLNEEYPKFYKMDELSKMAFLCTELLVPFIDNDSSENNLQMIFANSHASLHTDIRFLDSYTSKNAPSPSLFVYTLPNILTGELCIRNKWYGENCFYIDTQFSAKAFENRIKIAFENGAEQCLCGWVNAKSDINEECFIFLVSKSTTNNIEEELITTYKLNNNE